MIRSIMLASTGLVAVLGLPDAAKAQAANGYQCAQLIASTEARRQIPRGLLMAIAITESGYDGSPNPYAMNIAGRSYHASGTQEMANIIAANWQKGVRSIDVGCMQINLKYHGQKFANLTDLLHSQTNVEYGASYLISLATSRGSWREGVMDYHNKKNPGRRNWYGCKVWNNYLRIIHASNGYLTCGKTPNGSSVASNAKPGINAPLVIPGYNAAGPQLASAQTGTVQTSRGQQGMIGGQHIINGQSRTPPQATSGNYGHIPVGHPLDASTAHNPSVAQGGPIQPQPFDVEQPRERVMGTIDIANANENLGDITTSADPRASAFRSVRPIDWTERAQVKAETSQPEPPTTSRSHGGFSRSGPSS